MKSKILKGVDEYYTEKISAHGNTSLGVDWNSKESQYLRFEQLCKVIKPATKFSILDYGCGYAELINYLSSQSNNNNFEYFGFDLSEKMLQHAQELFKNSTNAIFYNTLPALNVDYVVASGIFNVKLNLANDKEWLNYILDTLHDFDKIATKGFSFNALTSYSDKDYKKDYLYYSNALDIFDYCKNNFSKNVALLHDYDLYEFTIIVRK